MPKAVWLSGPVSECLEKASEEAEVPMLCTYGEQLWDVAQQAVRDPHHMEWCSTPQRTWASLEVEVQTREW